MQGWSSLVLSPNKLLATIALTQPFVPGTSCAAQLLTKSSFLCVNSSSSSFKAAGHGKHNSRGHSLLLSIYWLCCAAGWCRETLRMLLQAAAADDDDTFEVAELNNDDEDDNACKQCVP